MNTSQHPIFTHLIILKLYAISYMYVIYTQTNEYPEAKFLFHLSDCQRKLYLHSVNRFT